MLELNINPKSPAAISSAFKKIKEMVSSGAVSKDTPIHIYMENGTYMETIKYNLSNPLVMEAAHGDGNENVVLQADNCEAYNSGNTHRAVFVIGPNATSIVLRNFSIVNTHKKTIADGKTFGDSADALVWNNDTGTLFCEGMKIESSQNTLFVKGYSWFKNSVISGDVDFIYGEPDTAFFEDCEIYVKEDVRGDFNAYAVNSQALAEKTGFVFFSCRFTGEKRKKASVFAYRTDGKGSAASEKNWDSAGFINCIISDVYSPEFFWDDDMNLKIYPRGNAKNGLREYNTKTCLKNGHVEDADTSRRSIMSYTLTEEDYFKGYASRFLILRDTPFKLD